MTCFSECGGHDWHTTFSTSLENKYVYAVKAQQKLSTNTQKCSPLYTVSTTFWDMWSPHTHPPMPGSPWRLLRLLWPNFSWDGYCQLFQAWCGSGLTGGRGDLVGVKVVTDHCATARTRQLLQAQGGQRLEGLLRHWPLYWFFSMELLCNTSGEIHMLFISGVSTWGRHGYTDFWGFVTHFQSESFFWNNESKCSNDPYSPYLHYFFAVISLTKSTTPKVWTPSCQFLTELLHKFSLSHNPVTCEWKLKSFILCIKMYGLVESSIKTISKEICSQASERKPLLKVYFIT